MRVKEIIGDYEDFFSTILADLGHVGIDVATYPLSHFGYKAETIEQYKHVCDALSPHAAAAIENIHNGRPIAKIILKEALELPGGYGVSLMEIMPPKDTKARIHGLEHCGFVVGSGLEQFKMQNAPAITEVQNQGPYCQPATVEFDDGTRVKFYEYSLKQVVELEGGMFVPVQQT